MFRRYFCLSFGFAISQTRRSISQNYSRAYKDIFGCRLRPICSPNSLMILYNTTVLVLGFVTLIHVNHSLPRPFPPALNCTFVFFPEYALLSLPCAYESLVELSLTLLNYADNDDPAPP